MKETLRDSDTDQTYCFLNEGRLRERVGVFSAHFADQVEGSKVLYAMKANSRARVMEILTEEGIDGFDCASGNEVIDALNYVPPDKVYFNHPVKRRSSVEHAYQRGVRYFTAQSKSGITEVLGTAAQLHGDPPELAIRVGLRNEAARIDLAPKFGCSPEEAQELLRRITISGARASLSIHLGSQNLDPESFRGGIALLGRLAQTHGGVHSLNLGGGFPANYAAGENYDLLRYLHVIAESIDQLEEGVFASDSARKIVIEPGRSIIAEAVDLAIPILEVRDKDGMPTIHVDDGIFTSFSDRAIHKWEYDMKIYTGDGRPVSKKTKVFQINGRTCDSGDVLGEKEFPADLTEGDFIWVKNAGAYMDSQSSHFNGFEPPHYISYNI